MEKRVQFPTPAYAHRRTNLLSSMSILQCLSIFCLANAAIAIAATPQGLAERKILNKIFTAGDDVFDGNFTPSSIAQHVMCGSNSFEIFGIHPSMGSELGGTPVAVAFRVTSNETDSQSELSRNSFDSATLACKFGEDIQPIQRRSELDDVLERLAEAANVTGDVSLNPTFQLLVCFSPQFLVPDALPGPLPFAISCKNEETTTNQASTMTFSFSIASSVYSVSPQLGKFGTEVTVRGDGFRNSSALICFFGKTAAFKTKFISSNEIRCTAPEHENAEFPVAVSNNGIDLEGGWATTTFAYVPLPIVESIDPQTITWGTNITIRILGRYFASHPKVIPVCSFDGYLATSAVVENGNVITCVVPYFQDLSVESPFISTVRVSTNGGADFSTSSLRAFFYHPIELFSYSLDVGTTVTVHGKNFHETEGLTCLFQLDGGDFIRIPATFYSMFQLHCQGPQSVDGHAKLWVATNEGVSGMSLNSLDFEFPDPLDLISINPAKGIVVGGTSITVRGVGFYPVSSFVCRFGLSIVAATVVNSTALSCVSPPAFLALAGRFFEEWGSSYDESEGTIVSLEISANDGHSFTRSGTTFQYSNVLADYANTSWDAVEFASAGPHSDIRLLRLLPTGGSELGGTDVEVQGLNFVQGLTCLFGNIKSPSVEFLSSSRIICKTPAVASASMHSSAVNVTLSLNSGEEIPHSLQFIYLPSSYITSFNPTFGTLDGGTSVHILGAGFDVIDGVPPICLFSNSSKSALAIVLSRTLIMCTIPPAVAASETTLSLSFNGGYDVVSTDESFKYVSSAVITCVSPQFISSNGDVKITIRGGNFIPEGNVSGVWRCSFGDKVVTAIAITTDVIICFAPPMKPGPVEVRVSINGVDFTTQSATVIYHLPMEILDVIPPFSRETGGELILVRGYNFQPSPDLSCIFSTSRGYTQAVEAVFESDTQVTCMVPSIRIGMATATLEISTSDDNARDNPRIPFQYYQLISISSIKLDENVMNGVVLEAAGFQPFQDNLICQVVKSRDGGSEVFLRSKVNVISPFEMSCRVPPVVLEYYENEFSISLGIVYNEIFYQLTDPRLDPMSITQSSKHLGTGHFQTPPERSDLLAVTEVSPTVFSEVGGSTINLIVSSHRVMTDNLMCLFSRIGASKGTNKKSTALTVTRHHSFENGSLSDSSLIACTTPRLVPGQYSLSVESSGMDTGIFLAPDVATITIIPEISITKFEPSSGSPGTEVTVYGNGFPSISLWCKIGERISGAKFLSNEKLVCPVSPLGDSQSLPQPYLSVSVSVNGQDFYEMEGSKFFFTEPPYLIDIFPAEGTFMGGTTVTIQGVNLASKTDDILVSFGGSSVKGDAFNETVITCITPPLETDIHAVPVRISTNGGHDFSESGLVFTYREVSISHVFPPFGPALGGNTVTVIGYGFTTSLVSDCRFGDVVVPATYISDEKIECVAPRSNIDSEVNIMLISDGVDLVTLPATYRYIPMFRILDVIPFTLPTDVPYTVRVIGESFTQLPDLICKLGTISSGNKAIVIDDSVLTCALPPVQYPGEVALDLVTENGDSMLEINSRGSLNFFDPSDFRISPSFGSKDGGTVVVATIGKASIVGVDFANGDGLFCRFFTSNEPSSNIDVVAEPLTSNTFSCVSPNVTSFWKVDDQLRASVALIKRELGSAIGEPFPFTFKLLPGVKSISPILGSIYGGTQVRVTSDGTGIWLNSSLLTCYFGREEGKAIWVSHLQVDCISPESFDSSEVLLTISDNRVDRSESQSRYYFHSDPVVTSVAPLFGLAPMDNAITFFGFGFSRWDVPLCIFQQVNGNESIYIDGTVLNETAMNCHAKSMSLDPAEYICMASNNGGLEYGRFGIRSAPVKYLSVDPPAISSLAPQSGIILQNTNVTVTGTSLSVEGHRFRTNCKLFDDAGSEIDSSLATMGNSTMITCVVRCPADNVTKYSIGVTVGELSHVYPTSKHIFWCYPKPAIVDLVPRFVSVGESTLIRISTRGILPSDCACSFGEKRVPARHTHEGVECLTPEFDHPQRIEVGFVLGDTMVMDGLQINAVDPISIDGIFPRAIYAGSTVLIQGRNFIPEAIICTIGGKLGMVVSASESEVVCRSSSELETTFGADTEVRLVFDKAPQISASAGTVEIYSAPRISRVTPSSGLALGGTNVIVRGANFHVLGDPSCFFGGIPVGANVISENTIACVTPASDFGSVQVQISLDSGRSLHGKLPFLFFKPIILREIYPRIVINGTKLRALGDEFNVDLPMQCAIGDRTFSKATFLSSAEATCTYAAADDSYGRLIVSMVTLNNIPASVALSADVSIVSHPLVEIAALSQLYGSAIGGESILLHVSGFVHDHIQEKFDPIHCNFAGKVAIANVLDEFSLSCTVPPAHSPGNVSLSLLYTGVPFSSNSLVFEYTSDAKVYEISPRRGAYSGGSTVRLSGVNLVPRGRVLCRFGQIKSYGYLDASANSAIYCLTPSINHVSSETIYLQLDPVKGWIDTGVDFYFFEPISIESISPLEIGPGIDFVTLNGAGFSNEVLCCFGEGGKCIFRKAIVMSKTTLECPFPWDVVDELYPNIPIALTANGVDFIRGTSNVTYNGMGVVLRSMSPNFGPSYGGTEVEIFGLGFQTNTPLTCWFGDVGTRATYVAHDHVNCQTSSVSVKESEALDMTRVTVTPGYSSLAPNHSDSSLSFVFYQERSSFRMHPIHGVSSGGTEVRLSHSTLGNIIGKLKSLGLQVRPVCQFASVAVMARIESNGLVCISPPKESRANATEAVRVSVSLNGKDFVFTKEEFNYYTPPTIRSVKPESVWIDSPVNISILGSHFLPLGQASCLLGDEKISAEVVSSSEIVCLVHVTRSFSYQRIVPVAISLNSVDVTNFVPLICRVNMPIITAATPLFVSDTGGSVVKLTGSGFEHVQRDGVVKLSGNNQIIKLVVSDDKSASFIVPPLSGGKTVIRIGFDSDDSFLDTGFELNLLPRLKISFLERRFIHNRQMTRITISGEFDLSQSYACVVHEDSLKNILYEVMAEHLNETVIMCDVLLQSHIGTLGLTIRRGDNNQTSNALDIFVSQEFVIDSIDPSILSEAEAMAGGIQFSLLSPREFPFNKVDQLYCMFLDATGTSSMANAEAITASEIRCFAQSLRGDVKVYLTRDGIPQSNFLVVTVRPTSQVLRLVPYSASTSGGTRLRVKGAGFSAYAETSVLCLIGDETSVARISDDENIFCVIPSTGVDGIFAFSLVRARQQGYAAISASELRFEYYFPTNLATCMPRTGPANGGTKVQLHHGGSMCGFECDYLISFTSVADSTRVEYSTTVQVISSSVLEVTTPPSPMGSVGGIVLIQMSRNGGHEFSAGVYYQYTEIALIQSFYPRQVTENSCFSLTFYAENVPFSELSCFIGFQKYSARHNLTSGTGTVSCSVCLDLNVGAYQIGLLTDNNSSLLAKEELSVEGNINLLKMIPPEGPVGGGTIVLVQGSQNFSVWNCQLYCFFGDYRAAAIILNSTFLQCIAPATNSSNEVVYIAPYHQQMVYDSDSLLNFKYYVQENISFIQPKSGPETGGTVVNIFGSGFLNRTSLSCKFGDWIMDAAFVNNGQIYCSSPPLRLVISQGPLPKSVPLMVSNNKHDFVPAGTFVYHDIPGISAILPSIGPASTKVTLYMKSSLGWVENPVCRFGDELANATVTSDNAIVCVSPPQLDSISTRVKLEISLNGIDFFCNNMTFQYSRHPLIYSISPSVGPMSGNNSVVVSGRSIDFSGDLTCTFGNIETMALWKSATTIACVAPPQTVGTVSFGVTSKKANIDIKRLYDDTSLHYTYLPPITITSISPTHGSIIGGTMVTIHADSFTSVEQMYCVFDGKATSIAHVTFSSNASAAVTCMTPQRNTSGIVSVGLAQDDLPEPTLLSLFDTQFRYVDEPALAAIYPRRGPAVGGTMVTLTGKNFFSNDMNTVFCKFGSIQSPAVFVSNEEVKCISPVHSPVREIQVVTITSNASTFHGSVILGFNNNVTDLIPIDSSAEMIRQKLSQLPGMEDISVSVKSSPDSLWMLTFLGFVNRNQPLITVNSLGLSGEVHVERLQSLCCRVTLSLNGLDYHGAEKQLMFVYDEKVAVIDIFPTHGSVSGGTPVNLTVTGMSQTSFAGQPLHHLKCVFGDDAVEGYWIGEDMITCSTPASYREFKVAVSIRIGTIRAESAAAFTFHKDPVVLSIFPSSLPAFGMATSSIRISASFYSSEMTCIFDVSTPSINAAARRSSIYRQPAIIQNSSHIDCPDPPSLQSFFSSTDLYWTTNATLIGGSLLRITLESGADLYDIGAIPYHAVVKITSFYPRLGPRSGGTEVIVDGRNFINSTDTLSCRFGSLPSKAHYVSPYTIICIAPCFPSGYGRVVVPVQVSLNGADFSDVSDNSLFEFHEALVVKHATPLVGLPKGGTVVNITLDDDAMRYRAVRDGFNSLLISHLDPPYGPNTGGNIVAVHCIDKCFTPDHFTACHFGNKTTPARYLSDVLIECLAPKATEDIMEVDVLISVDEISSLVQQRYQYLPIHHTFTN